MPLKPLIQPDTSTLPLIDRIFDRFAKRNEWREEDREMVRSMFAYLQFYIDTNNLKELLERLHTQNPASRAYFEAVTETKLPNTNVKTREFLRAMYPQD
jgi:hypothetical protein